MVEVPNSAFAWRKSSYSGGNGACVELAVPGAGAIAIRDSKNPDGPRLAFADATWGVFVREIGAA
ncbi:DUF397 domain-containing protein [Streptomyces sp. NPDC059740]|uniref:DUF397 domain-containing protein n=1 Tax=Streptomyces sp. NPDC059740 TaxID=3346926 RepID=UPI00364A3132